MITILHGDDIAASRNHLFDLKKKYTDVISFDGEKITITDLIESLESHALFETGDEKVIIIENLFSKKAATKEGEAIFSYINNNKKKIIVIWEAKELTKKYLNLIPNANTLIFKIPAVIFTFLDNFKPLNGAKLIKLFHQVLKNKDEEFVLYMLIRHIRILLALSEKGKEGDIEEIKRLSPWQKNKLESQIRLFTIEKLKSFYSNLYNIDLNLKTGKLKMTLQQAVDILLLGI